MLYDGNRIHEIYVNTVTTKQDRNPNSGLITYINGKQGKMQWRYLTSREWGCGRFLGPELSNSKTASILHRTQTP